jgi:shikimate dehydrogenase
MNHLAVTGHPVLHSKSPCLFNSAFQTLGIHAGYYRLAVEKMETALAFIKRHQWLGLNVTAPFKQDGLKLANQVSAAAELIGGVNTLVNQAGRMIGYNTDWQGVVGALTTVKPNLTGLKALVLGVGGAGCAAVYGLKHAGADVLISNRTMAKAVGVARRFSCNAVSFDEWPEQLPELDILISTISADYPLPDFSNAKSSLILFDADYAHGRLSYVAQRHGFLLLTGEQWLIHQAIPAFQYFFNQPADGNIMAAGAGNQSKLKNVKSLLIIGDNQDLINPLAHGLVNESGLLPVNAAGLKNHFPSHMPQFLLNFSGAELQEAEISLNQVLVFYIVGRIPEPKCLCLADLLLDGMSDIAELQRIMVFELKTAGLLSNQH